VVRTHTIIPMVGVNRSRAPAGVGVEEVERVSGDGNITVCYEG